MHSVSIDNAALVGRKCEDCARGLRLFFVLFTSHKSCKMNHVEYSNKGRRKTELSTAKKVLNFIKLLFCVGHCSNSPQARKAHCFLKKGSEAIRRREEEFTLF